MEITDERYNQLQIEEINDIQVIMPNTMHSIDLNESISNIETNQIEHNPNITPVLVTKISNNEQNTNQKFGKTSIDQGNIEKNILVRQDLRKDEIKNEKKKTTNSKENTKEKKVIRWSYM